MTHLITLAFLERHRPGKQDRSSRITRRIHEATNGIPHARHLLPFVDEIGNISDKGERRVHLRGFALRRIVKPRHTGGPGKGGPGLPAPLGAIYLHAAKRLHQSIELSFNKPWKVAFRRKRFSLHHAQAPLPNRCIRYFPRLSFGNLYAFHSVFSALFVRFFHE